MKVVIIMGSSSDEPHAKKITDNLDAASIQWEQHVASAHKQPKVRAWLVRHPRWVFHFTPTSASWLNAVEGFFSALTRRRLKRGVFHSIADLQAAINRYIAEHNDDPRPFTWTKPANTILAKLERLPVLSE